MIATVGGMFFYARWRLSKVVHVVPAKLGLNIQQTAEGFSISKSHEGRTQFTVSASKAVQFKQGGHADLHQVKIIVYGKDASRFDRITGDNFEYDPASGNVTAKGTVLIDLEANPEGEHQHDQSQPAQGRRSVHVESDGLTFNRNTGNAHTDGTVVFETPQAHGSSVGMDYAAGSGTMKLLSAIAIDIRGNKVIHLTANRGSILKEPRQILLSKMHVVKEQQDLRSNLGTFLLRPDNTVERIVAEGDVEGDFHGRSETHARSDRAELLLTGSRNLVTTAVLSGNVKLASLGDQLGDQPADGSAGRVTLQFAGQQILQKVHAEGGVRLSQKRSAESAAKLINASANKSNAAEGATQDIEMTAPKMDFFVKGGRILERAVTSGPPKIVILQPASNQRTEVTAEKFVAKFTAKNRISSLHGEPNARIVGSPIEDRPLSSRNSVQNPGRDKAGNDASATNASRSQTQVSSSQKLDVVFAPQGGIQSITQAIDVSYVDGSEKAWGQRGTYDVADQVLQLTGSPRIVDNGLTTNAQSMRMNRVTGEAVADGNVKSTYSDLKAQPDGGMLSSSDPIHVTSRTMTAHRASGIALYSGNARLWQNANVVQAPTIEFDRDHRSLVAQAGVAEGQSSERTKTAQPVSTVLVQVDKKGNANPVNITSNRLAYTDAERKIFLNGGVTAKGADATVVSREMTVFLLPRSQAKAKPGIGEPGQVDRIIAQDQVVITQPARHGNGEKLTYTSADDKFVLTGNSPSIFDAEHGKTTGDSLTFYRLDDRVLVEGRKTSPAVTRTQVAR